MSQQLVAVLTIVAALVTAGATIALWRVTKVLADETRRMAAATAQPQIVASIESNDWSFIHADLRVANTGNSTAFDVEINFEPKLVISSESGVRSTANNPLSSISVLKPGQEFASWIGRMCDQLDQVYTVMASWRSTPTGDRETYKYRLDMRMYKQMGRLGSGDPLIQVANSLKSIKEDVHRVIRSDKFRVDSFDQSDRDRDEAAWEAVRAQGHESLWAALARRLAAIARRLRG